MRNHSSFFFKSSLKNKKDAIYTFVKTYICLNLQNFIAQGVNINVCEIQ